MKGTLLIVEDQPNFREGLRMFIEQESIGWEVIGEAENGEEGMEKIKALQPDLVLMDIHMPVRNGIELAEWMFSNRIDTMFVIITGFQDFSYARSALRYGALDFLLKPCSDEDISRILLSAYDRLEEKRKNRHALITAKENTLRSVLLRLQLNEQSASQMLKTFNNRHLWLISVEDYFPADRNYREEDVYLIQYGILNIVQELIEKTSLPWELMVLTIDQFVLSTSHDTDLSVWKTTMINTVHAYLSVQLHVFPLGNCTDIPALLSAYAVYGPLIGHASRLLNQPYSAPIQQAESYRKKMMSLIVSGEADSLADYLSECCLSLQNHPLSEIKIIAIHHVMALQETAEILFPASSHTYSVNSILEQVQQLQAVGQVQSWLHGHCTEFLDRLNEWRDSANSNKTIFQRALHFIQEHYLENCSISQVAEHVHLNPSYFSTWFKKEKGETFTSYVNKLKLERAQVLLRNTDMKMIEIAQAVGFEDSTYFASIFKKYFQVSPSEFRQNQRLNGFSDYIP
ncbi:response regulator [Paenibacillus sp. FSL H8-0034]|uniref:response regulator n=1 Tax=Paenibacillus sp. FSL H8-0034 TaxID=2954671 RepID=UPI0030FAA71B